MWAKKNVEMDEIEAEIPKKTFAELIGGKVLSASLLIVPFFIGLTVVTVQEQIFREQLLRPIRRSNIVFNPFDEDAIQGAIANRPGYDLNAVQTSFLSPMMEILGGILMIIGFYFIFRYLTKKNSGGHYLKKTIVSFIGVMITIYIVSSVAFFSGMSFDGVAKEGFLTMKPFGKLQVLSWDRLSKCTLGVEKPIVGFDKLKYTFKFKNGEVKTLLVGMGAARAINIINERTPPEMSPEVIGVLEKNFVMDKNEALSERLDEVFANSPNGYNGSVLIAVDGKIIVEKGYGMADIKNKIPNTKDTVFLLNSITKQFTATSIMMLEEQGKLSLNDPVSKYLKGVKNGEKITIHHLLSMESGITDIFEAYPKADQNERSDTIFPVSELIREIKKMPSKFEPGTQFEYSNSNYDILGFIIEKVSGLEYGEFLKKNIFELLEMKNTAYDVKKNQLKNRAVGYTGIGKYNISYGEPYNISYLFAEGSLCSTVEDLYKWDQALYTEKLLKKETLEKMFKPNIGHYGYGWFIDEEYSGLVWHSGGNPYKGFISYIARYRNSKTTVIILQNEEDGSTYHKVIEDTVKVLTDEKIIKGKW